MKFDFIFEDNKNFHTKYDHANFKKVYGGMEWKNTQFGHFWGFLKTVKPRADRAIMMILCTKE